MRSKIGLSIQSGRVAIEIPMMSLWSKTESYISLRVSSGAYVFVNG